MGRITAYSIIPLVFAQKQLSHVTCCYLRTLLESQFVVEFRCLAGVLPLLHSSECNEPSLTVWFESWRTVSSQAQQSHLNKYWSSTQLLANSWFRHRMRKQRLEHWNSFTAKTGVCVCVCVWLGLLLQLMWQSWTRKIHLPSLKEYTFLRIVNVREIFVISSPVIPLQY